MAKFLLFSDIHVHPHKQKTERLHDCLKALNWCFEVAEENSVNAILFGGDLLHQCPQCDVVP
jgi:DNA repair exonuclease SbcCD nuclease subunit